MSFQQAHILAYLGELFFFGKGPDTGTDIHFRRVNVKGHEKVPREKRPRSVLITLLSNVLIPGLGNAYADAGPFSLSILILSLLVLFTTFSSVFPIVSLLSAVHLTQPAMIESGTVLVAQNNLPAHSGSLVGPSFSFLLVPLLLSLVHLLFLFVNNQRIAWKP